MATRNKAKAAESRHRPEVQMRRRINRSLPTEVNAQRKAQNKFMRNLKRGYT